MTKSFYEYIIVEICVLIPVRGGKMRHLRKVLVAFLLLSLLFSCNNKTSAKKSGEVATEAKSGLFADKIIYSVFMDESVGLKDVVEGRLDMIFSGTPSVLVNGLSEADRDKIDLYSVPSGSLALWLNPIPNKAPYTFKTTAGEELFNPLAIRDVRYAINYLINRKQIVDEVLLGFGDPMYTTIIPNMPGTYRYNLLPAKLGLTDTGDVTKARTLIEDAMKKASELPGNKGKLVKNDSTGFWEYKGSPALIKFYIRVDDPTIRLVIGREISDALEACGLKVERLEWDRSRSGKAVYGANPQDFICSMYTEAWGAGGTYAFHDTVLAQMGAPFFGYMPGGADSNNWNYKNDEIDQLSKNAYYGQYLTAEDYWNGNLRMNELVLKDAIRVWISSQDQIYITNKARLPNRVLYGLGDGFNMFSARTANVPADANGEKVLRIGQYSAMGKLFMSAWDPIGTGGFTDVFAGNVIGSLSDPAYEVNPGSAINMSLSTIFDPSQLKEDPKLIEKNGEPAMSGNIPVNPEAEKYDSATKTWKKVGPGHTAAVENLSKLDDKYFWHSGEAMSLADVRYADAFMVEWTTKDSPDDPYYDEPLESNLKKGLENNKGVLYNSKDGWAHSFGDYFFAPSKIDTAAGNSISAKAANPGRRTIFPWEIYEACAEIVAKSSASGTKWNILEGDENEIDIVNESCVKDIKAKLQEFIDTKHIPLSLKGIITEEDALRRYKASLAFIEKHGHAYISNGPGVLESIDPVTNSMTIVPFDKYPYKAHEILKRYEVTMTSIDHIKVPTNASVGSDTEFEINVSQFVFPNTEFFPSTEAKVSLSLQLPDGDEKVYTASLKADGIYSVLIPAIDTAKLAAGSYTVVALSSYGDESPSVKTASLILK